MARDPSATPLAATRGAAGVAMGLAMLSVGAPASAQSPNLSATEAGARYGQAVSVERHCPGGHATPAALALSKGYKSAARSAFDAEAEKVIDGWNKALGCRESDPETGRMVVACRRLKLASCRQAWLEIGPQGSAVPGLVELSLGDETGGGATDQGKPKAGGETK